MNEVGGENQAQRIGMIAGVLLTLLVLRRLRKRRKQKKLLKARAKAKAHQVEKRLQEEKAKEKASKKSGKKGKKSKKDRSILEQLVRFTILAVLKKIISQQIEQAGSDLGASKLGKKVVEAAEA
ncbi:MAG: hypothetical protein C4536_10630 [Actinobacteria bacterium]|nr:MAG: hypothetical protein C4536_10630 [Actinomycetota bacterium]